MINFIRKNLKTHKETIIGISPWVALLFVVIIVERHYKYLTTSFDQTLTGLETRTMYLAKVTSSACVGDVVLFRSKRQNSSEYRKITAGPGKQFTITKKGYEIDGVLHEMPQDWTARSAKRMILEVLPTTVPEGQFLIVNSDFAAYERWRNNDWTFEFIEPEQIRRRLTHIMFSTSFSQIGQSIEAKNTDCIG